MYWHMPCGLNASAKIGQIVIPRQWLIDLKPFSVKLQNTPSLICISLNKNRIYCYIPRSSKHTDTCNGWAGVFCNRSIEKILANHMWQACRNCQIKVIDLWRLRSHVSLTNFKPHLICVAMSKSTSTTMPVTEVQVFLICFRFSPSKFYPDIAIYFLKLRGIFST